MRPEILHVITDLFDGGAEATLYRLVCADGPRRHFVVSLMNEGKYGPLLQQVGAQVECLNMRRGRLTVGGLWRLYKLLKRLRPAIVQTWMYHGDLVGGVVARIAGVRRVCWGIHHTNLDPGTAAPTTILVATTSARLSRWVPDAIVCCAEKARETHAAMGYVDSKMVVIPNGYEFDRFCPDGAARERLRREWGVDENTFVIGMVGRYNPHKDHGNLLAALSRLKNDGFPFVCVLVGNGLVRANSSITEQIGTYGLQGSVLLLGPQDDIPAVMNALDIHVLSSSSEAFPNVLAEAMACGTPCVSTDVGDATQIVGDAGWIVPPRDPDALADAIRRAWLDWSKGNWTDRQEKSRRHVVDRFSVERMVRSYRKVWGLTESCRLVEKG